jgi:hypothetical protein
LEITAAAATCSDPIHRPAEGALLRNRLVPAHSGSPFHEDPRRVRPLVHGSVVAQLVDRDALEHLFVDGPLDPEHLVAAVLGHHVATAIASTDEAVDGVLAALAQDLDGNGIATLEPEALPCQCGTMVGRRAEGALVVLVTH